MTTESPSSHNKALSSGDPHPHRQAGVVHHVAVLPVDGDEPLGPGHGQKGLELALTGVPAHVDRLHSGVDHLGSAAVKAVDDASDSHSLPGMG